jgi:hypothetical protein
MTIGSRQRLGLENLSHMPIITINGLQIDRVRLQEIIPRYYY